MSRLSFRLPALLCAMALTGPAAARSTDDAAAETLLAQAMVERGAYAACATAAPKASEVKLAVARGWRLGLAHTAERLRQAGFADGYGAILVARSTLERATPRFAGAQQLSAFCAGLGNWQERLALLMNLIPQEGIARLLKPQAQ